MIGKIEITRNLNDWSLEVCGYDFGCGDYEDIAEVAAEAAEKIETLSDEKLKQWLDEMTTML